MLVTTISPIAMGTSDGWVVTREAVVLYFCNCLIDTRYASQPTRDVPMAIGLASTVTIVCSIGK